MEEKAAWAYKVHDAGINGGIMYTHTRSDGDVKDKGSRMAGEGLKVDATCIVVSVCVCVYLYLYLCAASTSYPPRILTPLPLGPNSNEALRNYCRELRSEKPVLKWNPLVTAATSWPNYIWA